MKNSDKVELIEKALEALLCALEENQPRATALGAPSGLVRMSDWIDPDADQSRLQAIIDNPIRAACEEQIRQLGQELFEINGTTGLMSDVLERVAAMNPDSAHRITKLDRAWNGIGKGGNIWLA